mgnify:CR=1 FL=1
MKPRSDNPIGIFDSGIGGLTVAKAIKNKLPNEQFIYFGDTAHLPYGEKSTEALESYVKDISSFLDKRSCKLMVVACNSASTVLDQIDDLPFGLEQRVDVIQPIVELLTAQQKFKHIGFIGTRKTIMSGLFQERIAKERSDLKLIAKHMVDSVQTSAHVQSFIEIDVTNIVKWRK